MVRLYHISRSLKMFNNKKTQHGLASTTELLLSLYLFPARIGRPSTYIALLPSLDRKKSPLFRSRILPCRRDTFQAGPSNERSTSTVWSWVERPTVIWRNDTFLGTAMILSDNKVQGCSWEVNSDQVGQSVCLCPLECITGLHPESLKFSSDSQTLSSFVYLWFI
jgi:hypothetical protein